jgi:ligand-binding sensor domain-containing protein
MMYNGEQWVSKLAARWTRSLVADKQGQIWTGSFDQGLTVFDGETTTTYGEGEGLSDSDVASLLCDEKGNVWVGTWGGGVNVFDGMSWKTYTTEDELGDNHVTALASDARGNIWAGMEGDGVSRFDGKKWTTYTRRRGLPIDGVRNIIIDPAGSIWVQGRKKEWSAVVIFDGKQWRETDQEMMPEFIVMDGKGDRWFGIPGEGVARLSLGPKKVIAK